MSSGEVIWYSPLTIGHIGDPIVTVDIGDAEKIETVDTQPEFFETFLLFDGQPTHTDIGTFVCRCTEVLTFNASVWGSEGEPIGIGQTESHLPTVGAWEVVRKVKIDGIALVVGLWE